MSEFTGYDPTIENRDEIRATSVSMGFSYGDYSAPEEVDPRPFMRHDKQFNMSSCQGFSLANACECVWALSQGFKPQNQLSSLFAYLESQRLDGGRLFGVDKGSTISSGLKVATTMADPKAITTLFSGST